MATIHNEEEYELLSDTETDILITDFPVDLIKENLRYQINNPLSTDVNYIENVIDRYRILRETFADNEDARVALNATTIDFFNYVIKEIDSKFDLSINIDMFDNIEDSMNTGTALYQFLILRYRNNVTKFIHKYITKNKKFLVEQFDDEPRKKDVTSVAVKKKIKNKDDALILSNLPKIINYIMTLDTEALDFLKYVASDDNYDVSLIRRLILEGNLLGEFVKDYLNIIVVEYDHIMDEIQTEVKTKLMNRL
jgi:hypothetical protein